MADYLNLEAEESDDETGLTKAEKRRLKKISRERDDCDDDGNVDDLADFIDDNVEVEEQKVKKRKRHVVDFDDRLEDDDFDLIEENVGLRIERNQYKRVRRLRNDDSDDEDPNARDAIANELFSGFDDEPQAEIRQNDKYQDLSDSDGEYSDIDGFIVDDCDEPVNKPKPKKRSRTRYNEAVLQEAQDIFGTEFDYRDFECGSEDVDVDGDDENGTLSEHGKSIFEVYEPAELEKAHYTEKDNEIRVTDVPERFQFREIPVTKPEESEVEDEAEWIQKHAFCTPTISTQEFLTISEIPELDEFGEPIIPTPKVRSVDKICQVLRFIRLEFFEVPFIAFYRKEYIEPDLNVDDLWKIYKWDEKWCQLQKTRNCLHHLLQNIRRYQRRCTMNNPELLHSDDFRVVTDNDINRLDTMQTINELRDAYRYFTLHYGNDLSEIRRQRQTAKSNDEDLSSSKNLKKAIRKDNYSSFLRAGIGSLVAKFGLTPEQFGENLRDNYSRHEVDQYPVQPVELAQDYICNQFPTADDVLKAARYVTAIRFSNEPLVRYCVRSTFFDRALLSVKPTKNGLKIIDENHPCYSFKYIKNKPIKDLQEEQFLVIYLAENEGLLKMTIEIDNPDIYLDEVRLLYSKDEFNQVAQEWNEQRSSVLELMLNNFLYPVFEKEMRLTLLNEAKNCVILRCCEKLNKWLRVAPYQLIQEEQEGVSNKLRVMSIAYSSDRNTAAYSALIDTEGEVVDFLKLPNLLKRMKDFRNPRDRDAKLFDFEAMSDFIDKHRPDVVVVGGECRDALMVIEDVKEIILRLQDSTDVSHIPVELIDNDLASVYMKSKKSETDFKEYPPFLRQAISLGRRLQDPLTEFCQVCTPEEDLLCLNFHSLQDHVEKDELLQSLYQEFINRTNEVGVDVTRALTYSHTSNLLQFVGGLGPRKAANLLKVVNKTTNRLENRSQLVTVFQMGARVFINCAGFIKIDTNSLAEKTETYVEVLDGTRVHPEAYQWAHKMAVDALDYDESTDAVDSGGAVEEIMQTPEKLNDLNLDAFAEELERQNMGSKSVTLYDIRSELYHPYKDLRTPYQLDAIDKFDMLTKETPSTFFIGKLISVTVTGIARQKPKSESLERAEPIRNDDTGLWQCPFCLQNEFLEVSDIWNHFDSGGCAGKAIGIRTRLDNGLSGFILTKNISDKFVSNPEDRVRIGMSLYCRVIKIDVDRFQVDLSCKSSDLMDKGGEWRLPKDTYYDIEAEERDIALETKKSNGPPKYIKRVIVHPAFQNIDYAQALKLMPSLEQGDVVVRPSSKGDDHLTCTWKVTDEICQHIDIRETEKTNSFSLGQSLWINNEEFEDLDEIIARHVQPMAAFARDLLRFQYYKDTDGGKKDVAEKLIIDEKKKHPNKINYFVTASKEFPGKFLLYYLPRNKICAEYISVIPDGFRFRQKVFQSVTSLMRWFKEHFRDRVPGTPASVTYSQTPASVTSIRTPANVGSQTPLTPNFNITNINPQIVQRAAANIPTHVFNTLSKVAGQTPSINISPGGFGYPQTPLPTPSMTPLNFIPQLPPTMTHLSPQFAATPCYQQSRLNPPQPPQWVYPNPNPDPRTQPQHPVIPRFNKPIGIDWAKAAAIWAKQNEHGDKPPGC